MSRRTTYRCGHPKTVENTRGVQCKRCHTDYMREYQRENYRRRYIRVQLPAAERKVLMLRREAARLGMHDLLGARS